EESARGPQNVPARERQAIVPEEAAVPVGLVVAAQESAARALADVHATAHVRAPRGALDTCALAPARGNADGEEILIRDSWLRRSVRDGTVQVQLRRPARYRLQRPRRRAEDRCELRRHPAPTCARADRSVRVQPLAWILHPASLPQD